MFLVFAWSHVYWKRWSLGVFQCFDVSIKMKRGRCIHVRADIGVVLNWHHIASWCDYASPQFWRNVYWRIQSVNACCEKKTWDSEVMWAYLNAMIYVGFHGFFSVCQQVLHPVGCVSWILHLLHLAEVRAFSLSLYSCSLPLPYLHFSNLCTNFSTHCGDICVSAERRSRDRLLSFVRYVLRDTYFFFRRNNNLLLPAYHCYDISSIPKPISYLWINILCHCILNKHKMFEFSLSVSR